MHRQEEIYLRQRGTINWTMKVDSPTTYFFSIANSRHHRCMIDSLIINNVMVSDHPQIMSHVADFFSSLLSAKPEVGFRLANYFWASQENVTSAKNEALLIPLSKDDIFEMKVLPSDLF